MGAGSGAPTAANLGGADALAAPPADGVSAARECLRRGDQACAVRALEGHATTPTSLALLIETYRATGDAAKARAQMQAFVARYPADPRAKVYERLLSAR